MKYVFDTSSIRSLQHFYPRVFTSIWDGLDKLVAQQELISTRIACLAIKAGFAHERSFDSKKL